MSTHEETSLPPIPGPLAERILDHGGRALLAGPAGIGKSTLAAMLADELVGTAGRCGALCADPGQPAFGPPAAVSRAERAGGAWTEIAREGLCTLDPARFRLPLVRAAGRLSVALGPLLVDAPGTVRGVAAAELLGGLAEATSARLALVLVREDPLDALVEALRSGGVAVVRVQAHPAAVRLPDGERQRRRDRSWRETMAGAVTVELAPGDLPLVGTPPPREEGDSWPGRVAAVLGPRGETLALGEVERCTAGRLAFRSPPFDVGQARALLVRDARRVGDAGTLNTDPPPRGGADPGAGPRRPAFTPRSVPDVHPDLGSPPVARRASVTPKVVNGLFGDPLVHLRLSHEKRSLLFDLGDASGLPGRIAHQVTDAFVTHAHMDHFFGFTSLLRQRVGLQDPVRIVGPPGIAERVMSAVRGFTWNLVGESGPRFRVGELVEGKLRWSEVRAGAQAIQPLGEAAAPSGLVLEEPLLRVRAAVLDHGTEVLAYALEETRHFAVRRERVEERGWTPGPWLGDLKRRVAAGQEQEEILLPDGTRQPAGALAADLLLVQPGQKLAYATDLADTPANRRTLVDLAWGADLLVCEASFLEEDETRARATRHLTARACGEIAALARVARLVPFHFSTRYEACPERVYAEVMAAFPRVLVPAALKERVEALRR